MSTYRKGRSTADRLLFLATAILAAIWIAPIVWVVGLSFKPNEILMRTTGGIAMPPFTLKNYSDAQQRHRRHRPDGPDAGDRLPRRLRLRPHQFPRP